VEGIASGADLHHLRPQGPHLLEGVLAQCGADVVAAVPCADGEESDAAVPALRCDGPRHVARETVLGLGDGDVGVPLGCVEPGDLPAVVLAPVAVLVGEDHLTHQGAEGLLVERAEGVDGEFGERHQVVPMECADEHGSAPFGLRARGPGRTGTSAGPLAADGIGGEQGPQ
jgi:hypothetical protein